MGVMGAAAFQLVDDPNDVTIWHDFETAEVARAFVSSDGLRNVMQRAGVQGEPQIWFTTESWRPAPSFHKTHALPPRFDSEGAVKVLTFSDKNRS